MYEQFENYDELVAGLAMLVWLVVGYRAGRLSKTADTRGLGRSARRLGSWIRVGLLVLVGKIATAGLLATHGWAFVANRMFGFAFVLIPVVAVVALSMPRVVRLRHLAGTEPTRWWRRSIYSGAGRHLRPIERAIAADPRLVAPVQLTALGAAIQFYLLFVARPIPPFTGETLVCGAIMVLGFVVTFVRFRRRQAAALSGSTRQTTPRSVVRLARNAGVLITISALGVGSFTLARSASILPATMSMSDAGMPGDMAAMDSGSPPAAARDVRSLTGEISGKPDVSLTLVARRQQVVLSSGQVIDGLTFNGTAPGPEIRVHEGQLVEVKLVNALSDPSVDGVTLHWHGLDVPNAEDGVAGVTQDAVEPGQMFVYRFRPHQVGTFWYHSHQASQPAVTRGLFGALIVLPPDTTSSPASTPAPLDVTVVSHQWEAATGPREAFGVSDTLARRAVAPGTPVRLRIISTSSTAATEADPGSYGLSGTSFRVAAIDGTDVNGPTDLPSGTRIDAGAGGRHDLTFTMPDHPVRLTDLRSPEAGLALSPTGTEDGTPPDANAPMLDPATYGTPTAAPITPTSHFDRSYQEILDDRPGFYDGSFYFLPTINGQLFPNTPMLTVREGDLVRVTYINRGHTDHPMHLHGHHFLVLTRNGKPVTGAPWWSDTLDVLPGEAYDIGFRADNPGIWMDHCHNLSHAATGMVQHLVYEGVTTPFATGRGTENQPE